MSADAVIDVKAEVPTRPETLTPGETATRAEPPASDVPAPAPAFTLLGDPGAAACEGDSCLIP